VRTSYVTALNPEPLAFFIAGKLVHLVRKLLVITVSPRRHHAFCSLAKFHRRGSLIFLLPARVRVALLILFLRPLFTRLDLSKTVPPQ